MVRKVTNTIKTAKTARTARTVRTANKAKIARAAKTARTGKNTKITKWHLMMPFLGDYQRRVILADMERELGVSHQTLKKYADVLVRAGVLVEERKPKNIMYSINKGNAMVLNYLSTAEKILLEEAIEKEALLNRLYEMLSPHMAKSHFIVFGSSARDGVGEDIDLLAIGTGSIGDAVSRFEKTYGKKVHIVASGDFSVSRALFVEIMKKHIIFNGFDAIIKSFWEFAWKG